MILVTDTLAFQRYPLGATLFCVLREGEETLVFQIKLNRRLLASCFSALKCRRVEWATEGGDFRIRGTASRVMLAFHASGEDLRVVPLSGKELARFREALRVLGRGASVESPAAAMRLAKSAAHV